MNRFLTAHTPLGDAMWVVSHMENIGVLHSSIVAGQRIELTGEEEIVLACGASTVRLTHELIDVLASLVNING